MKLSHRIIDLVARKPMLVAGFVVFNLLLLIGTTFWYEWKVGKALGDGVKTVRCVCQP